MREGGKTKQAERSFVRDTGRLWNQAPTEIKEAGTIGIVKQKYQPTARHYNLNPTKTRKTVIKNSVGFRRKEKENSFRMKTRS